RELGRQATQRHPPDESGSPAPPQPVRRSRRRIPWAVAVLVPLLIGAVAGIVILLSYSNGPTSTRIGVGLGGGDKPPTSALELPTTTRAPAGKQVFGFGRPLYLYALVQRPPLLSGVRNWTLETTRPRGGWFGDRYHFDETGFVALHPDGHLLAVVGIDATIRI